MNLKDLKGNIFLLIATLIWGCTFVAQDIAAKVISPFEFQAVRTLIGAVVLVPVILVMDGAKKKSGTYRQPTKKEKRDLLTGGLVCGFCHCIAACLQQWGMALGTPPGKSGFITAMYIIFVPVIGLLLKKKIQPHIYGCIVFAVAGLYLLCVGTETFTVALSDTVTLACAVAFAFHILSVDHFVDKADCVKLSCLQFVFSGLLAVVFTFIFEGGFHPDLIWKVIGPILFAGVLSCGVAYTFQVIGQKFSSSSTVASLIMSFESVVATVAGAIVLKQMMSGRELIGCALMFVAIIFSQIDLPSLIKRKV